MRYFFENVKFETKSANNKSNFACFFVVCRKILSGSNSLDPDQARRFVGPDLDPNCLQRLSAVGKSRQVFCSKTSIICVCLQCVSADNTSRQSILNEYYLGVFVCSAQLNGPTTSL